MKKNLSLLLTLGLAVSLLAGCSSGNSTDAASVEEASSPSVETTSDGQSVLTVAAATDPGSYQPWGSTSTCKFYLKSAIYEPLFWMNMDKELTPILGKSYENLGDGVYEVTLFDYIVDSAGNSIKASDVIFSLDKFIEDGTQARLVANLESYEAADEYTVRFTFSNDRIGNFESLATALYILSEDSYNASPDEMVTTPVGSGRYALTDYVSGSYFTVEKRDSYWQTDEQYICEKNSANADTIVVKTITDNNTIAIALENGEIDFTENIVEDDRVNFVNEDGSPKDGYISILIPNNSLIHLTYNCGPNSQLQDINLRKAISYAVDAEALAVSAQGNLGEAVDALINPNWLDADAELNSYPDGYYEYNPELAKEYLEKSNYDGSPLRLLVLEGENTSGPAVLVQSYCKQVGIEVELLTYDDALYKELRVDETGLEYDMDLGGIYSSNAYTWKNSSELDIHTYLTGVNHCFITDEKLQELYDIAANSKTNSPEAANDLVTYAADQCYQYGLFYFSNEYFARSERVENIVVGPSEAFAILGAFVVK